MVLQQLQIKIFNRLNARFKLFKLTTIHVVYIGANNLLEMQLHDVQGKGEVYLDLM